MSDGKEKTEIKKKKKDRVKNRSVTVSALICSGEAGTRLLVYWSTYVFVTYGHDLWVVTEK